MCGIGGIILTENFDQSAAIMAHKMLASLTRRGRDAWGFFDLRRIYKEPGSYLTSYYPLINTLVKDQTSLYLCHTREATDGDPKENKNNHPFWLDSLVLAHNGVLYAYDKFPNPWGIETDSFAILYWINEEYKRTRDIVEAIDLGLKHVVGVYACWLYNRDDGKTYIFRNANPLMATTTWQTNELVMFASDKKAIYDSLPRYKRMLLAPKPIPPCVIYAVDETGINEVGSFVPLPTPLEFDENYIRMHRELLVFHAPEAL